MALVLHVISGLKVGGAEMAMLRLASGQGGAYRHLVVSMSPEGAMRERLAAAGVELIVFDFKRAPVRGLLGLFRVLRQRRPEIVQTWLYHADLVGGILARLAGRRHVVWGIRTTDVSTAGGRMTALIRRLCAACSRWVPAVIVCVAEAARRSHAAIGYFPGSMTVVPNGFELAGLSVDAAAAAAQRTALGLTPQCVAVGFVGRFHPDKDQHNFIGAAARVAAPHPQARFLMAGRGVDAANPELAAWIAASGCPERFILLGERADVVLCLAAMDLFCLSSRTEGFPNVVGEAMAMGLPCVVTDAGDAALLVADTGSVVPVADPAALAHALDAVLALPAAARRQMGARARERVRAEYAIERTRARFEAIYQTLINKESA